MSHKKYNEFQIQELKGHKYVKGCSEKYITFTDEFKHLCIQQDNLGVYHREIFKMCEFPEYIVESGVPAMCLKRWRALVKKSGEQGLTGNKKGRPKRERINPSKMTKDEYIEYLEAQVVSMSEVQRFLKRGKYP